MRKAVKNFWRVWATGLLYAALGVCGALFLVALDNAVNAATFDDWQDGVITPDTPVDVLTADIPDVECMALNIYHETRGEGTEGQEVVVASVYTRMQHGDFPDTVCGVVKHITRDKVTKRFIGQYSWTLDGETDEAFNVAAYRGAYLLAIDYMFMGRQPALAEFDRIIGFHATWVNPDWSNWEYLYTKGGHKVFALFETEATRGRDDVNTLRNKPVRNGSAKAVTRNQRVPPGGGQVARWEFEKRRSVARRLGET